MPKQEFDNGLVDESGPSRGIARQDVRLDLRQPEPSGEHCQTDYAGKSLWNLFASVKYWAAKQSPREPGQRPDDLRRAAELLRESLEMTWRAGYKGEDVADVLLRTMKS